MSAVTSGFLGCGPASGPNEPPVAERAAPKAPEAATSTLSGSTPRLLGPLTSGEPRLAALKPGEVHLYTLDLDPGDAVRLEVDQQNTDLEATILDSEGGELLTVDLPVGQGAPERICFIADSEGPHGIRLNPFGDDEGAYRVEMIRRPATRADRHCFEAIKLFVTATARRYDQERSPALIEEFVRAHDLWIEAEEPFLGSLALREIGSLWFDLGRGTEAIAAFVKALPLARKASSRYLEVSLLNRLGLAHLDRGDFASALPTLSEGLTLAQRSGDRRGEASALHNLGRAEEAAGETHRAIERYRRALDIWRELGRESNRTKTQQRLADAYALLDHHEEALHLLEDALVVFRRKGQKRRLASTLVSIGWVHYLRGEAGAAIAPLQEALKLQRGLGNLNHEAATLDRLGTVLRETGDFDAALEAYRQSLILSEEARSSRDAAHTKANIGCLYQQWAKNDQHWAKNDQARARLTEARDQLLTLDDLKALSHVESCLARVAHQAGDSSTALAHIERAMALVDDLRTTARRRGARYRPIWLWQDYGELHQDLLMARYGETEDEHFAVRWFEASDQARARNLFELVLESQVGVRAAANPQLLARERQIQGRLRAVEEKRRQRRGAGAPASEIAGLERQLESLSLELEEARSTIRAADPRYAELAAPQPVDLSQLQQLLPPETVLLSYALGEESATLFVVDSNSLTIWPLESRASLDAQAGALYRGLRDSRFPGLQQRLTARALGETLLPPEAIPASVSRLLVVASGLLHYVPFASLPSPRADSLEEQDRLVIDDFEIEYLPSASVLAALRNRDSNRAPAPGTVAMFADAIFSKSDPRLITPSGPADAQPPSVPTAPSISAERLPEGPLPRLPFTGDEASAILALVAEGQALPFLEFDATRQAVLEAPLDRYRIVHFATHALIDERFPELSGLVLSRHRADSQSIDGDLPLHEIYQLRLAADLVVLSGCQTALGRRIRGDGLLSLTRGFLYAGASQVLVSLWSVDDEATAALMAELYRGLLERGESPATALRSAQLWMRASPDWRAPYYWAAFVLQGAAS